MAASELPIATSKILFLEGDITLASINASKPNFAGVCFLFVCCFFFPLLLRYKSQTCCTVL